MDSRENAKNVSKQPKDSRICDEKLGLFKDSQGRALGVRNRPEQPEIANLSRKAESTSELAQDSRILELESGFFKRAQGRILGVCNRSACAEIDDSSPKAESTSPK